MSLALLKEMDKYITKNIKDEQLFIEEWLTYGIPDDVHHEDLEFILLDRERYIGILESFVRSCILDD